MTQLYKVQFNEHRFLKTKNIYTAFTSLMKCVWKQSKNRTQIIINYCLDKNKNVCCNQIKNRKENIKTTYIFFYIYIYHQINKESQKFKISIYYKHWMPEFHYHYYHCQNDNTKSLEKFGRSLGFISIQNKSEINIEKNYGIGANSSFLFVKISLN